MYNFLKYNYLLCLWSLKKFQESLQSFTICCILCSKSTVAWMSRRILASGSKTQYFLLQRTLEPCMRHLIQLLKNHKNNIKRKIISILFIRNSVLRIRKLISIFSMVFAQKIGGKWLIELAFGICKNRSIELLAKLLDSREMIFTNLWWD